MKTMSRPAASAGCFREPGSSREARASITGAVRTGSMRSREAATSSSIVTLEFRPSRVW